MCWWICSSYPSYLSTVDVEELKFSVKWVVLNKFRDIDWMLLYNIIEGSITLILR